MGCLDELGILEDGQCCIRVSSSASYPEIHDINFEIIQGKVVIAKTSFIIQGIFVFLLLYMLKGYPIGRTVWSFHRRGTDPMQMRHLVVI